MTPEQYLTSELYRDLNECAHGAVTDARLFTSFLLAVLRRRLWEEPGWYDPSRKSDVTAPCLSEFITRRVPDGIGSSIAWVWATLATAKNLGVESAAEATALFLAEIPDAVAQFDAAINAAQKPLPDPLPPEQSGKLGGRGNKGSPNGLTFTPGNSASYLLARLKRDHPEIAARVVSGELSANAGAIAAGFRRKPSALENLNRAWGKATPEERQAFMSGVNWPE